MGAQKRIVQQRTAGALALGKLGDVVASAWPLTRAVVPASSVAFGSFLPDYGIVVNPGGSSFSGNEDSPLVQSCLPVGHTVVTVMTHGSAIVKCSEMGIIESFMKVASSYGYDEDKDYADSDEVCEVFVFGFLTDEDKEDNEKMRKINLNKGETTLTRSLLGSTAARLSYVEVISDVPSGTCDISVLKPNVDEPVQVASVTLAGNVGAVTVNDIVVFEGDVMVVGGSSVEDGRRTVVRVAVI